MPFKKAYNHMEYSPGDADSLSLDSAFADDHISLQRVAELEVRQDEENSLSGAHHPEIPPIDFDPAHSEKGEELDQQTVLYLSPPPVYHSLNQSPDHSLAEMDSLALAPQRCDVLANPSNLESEIQEPYEGNKRKKMGILICLLLIAVIVLSVVLTRDKSGTRTVTEFSMVQGNGTIISSTPTQSPSLRPTPSPTSRLQNSLAYQVIGAKVNNTALLLDASTPQGQAFQEIASQGMTDKFRILQRYALAVLFFTTGGENWQWLTGWQALQGDECLWYGIGTCRMQPNNQSAVSNIRLGKCGLSLALKNFLPSESKHLNWRQLLL